MKKFDAKSDRVQELLKEIDREQIKSLFWIKVEIMKLENL